MPHLKGQSCAKTIEDIDNKILSTDPLDSSKPYIAMPG